MLKKYIFSLLVCVGFLGFSHADLAGYGIDSFHANFDLQKDGVLAVKEDISVSFFEQRHGIYRTIPILHYRKDYNDYIKTPIESVYVAGKDFTTQELGKNFNIRIGTPGVKVSGSQHYPIEYAIRGAIRQFSGYQELYRDLLGTERKVPIRDFTFTLNLPEGIELGSGDFYAVKGTYGATDRLAVKKEGNQISSLFPLDLREGENVTISVVLPDGTVPIEEFVERKGYKEDVEMEEYKDYKRISLIAGGFVSLAESLMPYWFLLFLLFLVSCGYIKVTSFIAQSKSWMRQRSLSFGDIEKIKEEILNSKTYLPKSILTAPSLSEGGYYKKKDLRDVVCYDLPKGYSPAEISLLTEDCLTWEAIAATLCDWQVRGYVLLTTDEYGGTVITRKNQMGSEFSDFEKRLWRYFQLDENGSWNSRVFRSSSESLGLVEAMLAALMEQYKNDIYVRGRMESGIRSLSPGGKLESWVIVFLILPFVLVLPGYLLEWIFWVLNGEFSALIPIFGIPLIFFLPFIFGSKRPGCYYTQKGKEIKEHILGFRKFLKTVEQDKLDVLLRQDPSYFEKVLPYAIAMGVGTEWIKKCGSMIEHLKYYQQDQDYTNSLFMGGAFAASVASSMNWSDPSDSRSSSGGSSDFGSSSSRGGGGYSGGGGGGGGGGSW